MTRLLATTAVLMTLSGAAFAQTATAPTTDSTVVAPAVDSTMGGNMEIGAMASTPTDFYASDLIGMRIYNVEVDYDTSARIADGAETEWDDIGEINDLVITADGKVSAVILGVGGFLGIGERDVAVNMGAITVVTEDGDSNDRFLVVKTSKEQLEALTEFKRDNM